MSAISASGRALNACAGGGASGRALNASDLPDELVEYIGGLASVLGVLGRLRQVWSGWRRLGFEEFAMRQPLTFLRAVAAASDESFRSPEVSAALAHLSAAAGSLSAALQPPATPFRVLFVNVLRTTAPAKAHPLVPKAWSYKAFPVASAVCKNRACLLALFADLTGLGAANLAEDLPNIIDWATERGHKEVFRVLRDRFAVGPDALLANKHRALHTAAMCGRAALLEFFADEFGLRPEAVRECGSALVTTTVLCGRANMLELLADRFGVSAADARAENNAALRVAAAHGREKIVRILVDKFALDVSDATVDATGVCDVHMTYLDKPAIVLAARYGHAGIVKIFSEHFGLGAEAVRVNTYEAFCAAAEYGQVAVLAVFADQMGFAAADARAVLELGLLVAAAEAHVLAVLEFLSDRFALGPADIRAGNNALLCRAVKMGHAKVLEYLADRFGLGSEDARGLKASLKTGSGVIKDAVERGYPRVLEVLLDRFGFTADDLRARENALLRHAVAINKVDVLAVLRDRYGLGAADARARHNEALFVAASRGKLDLLEELVRFGLTADDVRGGDRRVLKHTVCHSSVNVLEFLVTRFKLTALDARIDNNYLLLLAIRRRRPDMVAKLAELFGLGREDVLSDGILLCEEIDQPAMVAVFVNCYGVLETDLAEARARNAAD